MNVSLKSITPNMLWDRENVDRVCEANSRVFLTLPEILGAKEALNELKNYFEIYFASVPMWNVDESWTDKVKWLKKNYPWAEKNLILTHNKGILKGDFIIDDRTVHGVDKFEGEHLHFGTETYSDWGKIVSYLKTKI